MARTLPQGAEILKFTSLDSAKQAEARHTLFEMMRHVIRCIELRDQLATTLASGHAEFSANQAAVAKSRFVKLPGVADLQSKAESFLQSAKLAAAQVGELTLPFYGTGYSHKFNKIVSWAKASFGEHDAFTSEMTKAETFVGRIVKMRNCVDHPKTEPGAPLVTGNFKLKSLGSHSILVDPTWGMTGEPPVEILPDWRRKIEQLVEIGEAMLLGLFRKNRASNLVEAFEIPEEKRDKSCPIRWEVRIRY